MAAVHAQTSDAVAKAPAAAVEKVATRVRVVDPVANAARAPVKKAAVAPMHGSPVVTVAKAPAVAKAKAPPLPRCTAPRPFDALVVAAPLATVTQPGDVRIDSAWGITFSEGAGLLTHGGSVSSGQPVAPAEPVATKTKTRDVVAYLDIDGEYEFLVPRVVRIDGRTYFGKRLMDPDADTADTASTSRVAEVKANESGASLWRRCSVSWQLGAASASSTAKTWVTEFPRCVRCCVGWPVVSERFMSCYEIRVRLVPSYVTSLVDIAQHCIRYIDTHVRGQFTVGICEDPLWRWREADHAYKVQDSGYSSMALLHGAQTSRDTALLETAIIGHYHASANRRCLNIAPGGEGASIFGSPHFLYVVNRQSVGLIRGHYPSSKPGSRQG